MSARAAAEDFGNRVCLVVVGAVVDVERGLSVAFDHCPWRVAGQDYIKIVERNLLVMACLDMPSDQ